MHGTLFGSMGVARPSTVDRRQSNSGVWASCGRDRTGMGPGTWSMGAWDMGMGHGH